MASWLWQKMKRGFPLVSRHTGPLGRFRTGAGTVRSPRCVWAVWLDVAGAAPVRSRAQRVATRFAGRGHGSGPTGRDGCDVRPRSGARGQRVGAWVTPLLRRDPSVLPRALQAGFRAAAQLEMILRRDPSVLPRALQAGFRAAAQLEMIAGGAAEFGPASAVPADARAAIGVRMLGWRLPPSRLGCPVVLTRTVLRVEPREARQHIALRRPCRFELRRLFIVALGCAAAPPLVGEAGEHDEEAGDGDGADADGRQDPGLHRDEPHHARRSAAGRRRRRQLR